MRMTKKVLSIVLAVMMVVSMMSVMAVSANAVGTTLTTWDDVKQAAQSGGYYELGNDIEYCPTADDLFDFAPITVNKDLTIDGNGYSFKAKNTTWGGYYDALFVVNKFVLTLKNVSYDGTAGYDGSSLVGAVCDSLVIVKNDATATLRNVTTTALRGKNAIVVKDEASAGLFDCSINNTYLEGDDIVIDPAARVYLDGTTAKVGCSDPEYNVVTDSMGFLTATPKTYVAQIGDNKYETLEEAFAAAVDGDKITVLADSTGNGIKAPQGKFATGLTVDFANHTYTVNANTVGSTGTETQAFQLLKDNKITFQNGTINSSVAKMLVQNYSNLTLDNMVLDGRNLVGSGRYTLSNNNGNVVINDTTIYAKGGKGSGNYAFDVCRYSSYSSVNVTVKGNSEINGDVEISASNGDAKDGFSLTLESGTMDGDIVVDQTAKTAMATAPDKTEVTKKDTFTKDAPAGYEWVSNGDGTSSLSHVHDWDYENVSWTFTENASHNIYAKYTLTCKTDATHTKEQTGSGTLMSTVAVSGDKFVYSHAAVKIDGNSVAVPNYTRNVADGIINQYEFKAAVKVAGEYKLANDITGFYDYVKPVDGFVLDGQNHMIKYGTINAGGRVMFEAADQNTKFTLKNITLDGNKKAKWAVCAYTGNSGNNAGNVITLEGVTIQNFKSTDYVGAINAFGSSTWNLKNCTITGNTTVDDSDGLSGSAVWAGSKATINIDGGTYDEVYLHSYSGTGAVLNADGGATIGTLALDLTKTDTLKANIDTATVGAITSNDGTIPEEAVVMDPANATVAAPEGYKWVDSDETGMKTLAQIVYVAEDVATGTKYETVNEAVAAAGEGGEVKLISDIYIAAGELNVGIDGDYTTTLDLNGHTITNEAGSGITLYSAYPGGKTFTIKDSVGTGGITSTKKYTGDGCISDSSGRKVVIEGGTYTSNDKALYISSKEGWTINGGTFNGKIHVISDVAIKDGTFNGEVVQSSKPDYSTPYPWTQIPAEIAVSGGTFSNPVPADFCAEGFQPKTNGDGTYTVEVKDNPLDDVMARVADGNVFGIPNSDYRVGAILGVQKKSAVTGASVTSTDGAQEALEGNDMRFVAVLNTEVLEAADDYGFVLVKDSQGRTTNDFSNANFDKVKAFGGNGEKTISCAGTSNTICGDYGKLGTNTEYKYITCAVNGVNDTESIVARFYVTLNGKTYYGTYGIDNFANSIRGCAATYGSLN